MPSPKKSNRKSLKQACWARQTTVTALCEKLGITRQTAYCAWNNPQAFPVAAPKLFSELQPITE